MQQETLKKSYYAIIPANVRYDKNLTANAKLLYEEITALCNKRGYCWATNSYFADLYDVSKMTISKWIKSLVDCGYIKSEIIYKNDTKEIESRYITIVQYPINKSVDMPIDKKEDTYKQKDIYPINKKEYTPIYKKLKDNNTVYANNTFNNTKDNKEKFDRIEKEKSVENLNTEQSIICNSSSNEKTSSVNEIIENYCKTADLKNKDEVKELLLEWLKIRKESGAITTNKLIELNLDKLNEYAEGSKMEIEEYLRYIIMHGWKTFYPIHEHDNSVKSNLTSQNTRRYDDNYLEDFYDIAYNKLKSKLLNN